ncbi:MAG: carbamoyltransferase HypF [Desulfobacterales bacterium]|nr:MAG: carbamoyltransferase HypF [Desulfobacterales bacterium]
MTYRNRKDLSRQFLPARSSSTSHKSLQNGVEIHVHGTVQGVGFRPFIFNLASRFAVSGFVTNTGDGVLIKAFSGDERLLDFIDAIREEAPPLSDITGLSYVPLEERPETATFTIIASKTTDSTRAVIPPDIATCDDCLRELKAPDDFRYQYPFINCTNCGPRFTITESIPYDRPKTSMKVFPMCQKCHAEYEDPADRRFHAQPNACPDCGPQISWHDAAGKRITSVSILETAVNALLSDSILAIRGLGGFHLCVNAFSESAIATLRSRKNRPDKPLAIMVPDIETVDSFCIVDDHEKKMLLSPEHPILLLKPRSTVPLAANLFPDSGDIGVMLPYTPLHHLLFATSGCPSALVMTSGNVSGEPICTANEEAIVRLATIADNFLFHNRDIVTRVDDSVVKYIAGQPRLFRRARGFVPSPLHVPYELPQMIGCGGGLKSTFSLTREKMIFPSQHIGDLFNQASYAFFTESVENLKTLLKIEPEGAVCDLHPDYMSSRFAKELGLPLYEVQHHHAHAAAVMAEHGLTEPVLAVVLDGTGFGTDGTSWGGEILQTGLCHFSRLGSLETMLLPGGDAAAGEPWRMGMSLLHQTAPDTALTTPLLTAIDDSRKKIVWQMLENRFNTPQTSSCGRLFDAVSALLGLNYTASYEGQAAMQLEYCARKVLSNGWKNRLLSVLNDQSAYLFKKKSDRWQIISSEFVKNIVYDISSGGNRHEIALSFHSWLISCISRLVEKLSETTGIKNVVLAGGCMQNAILLEGLIFTLTELGLTTYTGSKIPINDGGISVGQAVIGGLKHVSCSTDEG